MISKDRPYGDVCGDVQYIENDTLERAVSELVIGRRSSITGVSHVWIKVFSFFKSIFFVSITFFELETQYKIK